MIVFQRRKHQERNSGPISKKNFFSPKKIFFGPKFFQKKNFRNFSPTCLGIRRRVRHIVFSEKSGEYGPKTFKKGQKWPKIAKNGYILLF